jgi:methylglutamate dehydrogenase subunit D
VPDFSDPAVTVATCQDAALAVILVRRGKAAEASQALQARCGLALPPPGRLSVTETGTVLWNGPDRFLVVRQAGGPRLAAQLGAALDGLAYVAEASSSRALLSVTGDAAAERLNRLLAIDLHPRAFAVGSVALTIAAHVPVQIWRPDDASFWLACPSSLAASFHGALRTD